MCGVAGILRSNGAEVCERDLVSMASALSHRGPDSSGVWVGDDVGFAHTRLSLFDLTDAASQPWIGDGDVLVFNGEIYNFVELRRDLEQRGRSFKSTSDTEVLFASLQMDGVDRTLDRIRGMFAFAFFHGASRSTYLVRDRFGIKPLVYTDDGGGVVFASEVKALMALRPPTVDETLTLLSMRTLGDKFQRRTLFSDVRQVAPGSVLTVRDGRVVAERVYQPLLGYIDESRYRSLDRASFDDVCDELEHLLAQSVVGMRASDAALGVFLSGGLDSSLVSALAAADGPGGLRAFTSDVVGAQSELAAATAVAGHLGVPLDSSQFRPDDWTGEWVRTTWHLETPVITNPSAVPFGMVASLAQLRGYKAVLTGEGADELFLGYPRLASGGLERVAGAPLAAMRRIYGRVPGLLDALLEERDWMSSQFVRGIAGGFEDEAIDAEAVERYSFVGSKKEAYTHARSAVMAQTSLQALLQRNDRMGMSASIESRFPFLDEDVVSFALNLPVRWKLRRSRAVHDPKHPFVLDKAPVRSVGARYLGHDLAHQRKAGFPTPGLRALKIRNGAFRDSWIASTYGAGRSFDSEIAEWPQSYDVGKLMSVEIFGRLFSAQQSIDEVEQFVERSVVSAG